MILIILKKLELLSGYEAMICIFHVDADSIQTYVSLTKLFLRYLIIRHRILLFHNICDTLGAPARS